MLNLKSLENGQERYRRFINMDHNNDIMVRYEYKSLDGRLFSTVKKSVEICKMFKYEWLKMLGIKA